MQRGRRGRAWSERSVYQRPLGGSGVTSMIWVGYFLGQTPLANRLDKIIVIVIFVSVLPMLVGGARGWLRQRRAAA